MRNIVTDIGKNMTIPSNVLVFSQVLRVSVTVIITVIVIGIVCLVSVPGQPTSNVKVLVISPYILQVSWEVGMSVCLIAVVYLNNIFQSFISLVISLVYLFLRQYQLNKKMVPSGDTESCIKPLTATKTILNFQ